MQTDVEHELVFPSLGVLILSRMSDSFKLLFSNMLKNFSLRTNASRNMLGWGREEQAVYNKNLCLSTHLNVFVIFKLHHTRNSQLITCPRNFGASHELWKSHCPLVTTVFFRRGSSRVISGCGCLCLWHKSDEIKTNRPSKHTNVEYSSGNKDVGCFPIIPF